MSDSDGKYQWNPGGGGQASDLSSGLRSATTFQTTVVGETSVACQNVHWISVKLVRQPDLNKRPSWWATQYEIYSTPYQPMSGSTTVVKDLSKPPYASEPYAADTTNGKKTGSLDGSGVVRFDNIPAGNCQFKFVKFYDAIEKYFKDELAK